MSCLVYKLRISEEGTGGIQGQAGPQSGGGEQLYCPSLLSFGFCYYLSLLLIVIIIILLKIVVVVVAVIIFYLDY